MNSRKPAEAARFDVEMLEGRLVFSAMTVAPAALPKGDSYINGDQYINFLPPARPVVVGQASTPGDLAGKTR